MSLAEYLEQQGRKVDLANFPDNRGVFDDGNPRQLSTFGGRSAGNMVSRNLMQWAPNVAPDPYINKVRSFETAKKK